MRPAAAINKDESVHVRPPRGMRHAIIAILTVVGVIAVVETGRRAGVAVPVPFLMLYGSVAVAAGFAGLRIGVMCATLAAGFVVYCAMHGFGPPSLTGGTQQVFLGIFLSYLVGVLLGRHHDKLLRFMKDLANRDKELTNMHDLLAQKVERRTNQLVELNAELDNVRNRLDSAVQHSPAGVVIFGQDRKIVSANNAALRMFDLESLPTEPMDACELFSRERTEFSTSYGQQRTGALSKALKSGTVSDNVSVEVKLADGKIRHLRCSFAPVVSDGGEITGATAVLLDETSVVNYQHSLKRLSQRLMSVQEDERAHIARELHDEIGQHLTGIKMLMHAVATNPGDRGRIDMSVEKIDELMQIVRNLSLELRPSVLDDLGLTAALRWYLRKQRLPGSSKMHFSSQAATAGLSPEAKTAAFRIIQEAVNNAMKHAGAANIYITLFNDGDDFCLEVEDDGRGFLQVKDKQPAAQDLGFGLLFMRERAQELSGECLISSNPENGTLVSVKFPIAVAG